ncbi:SA1362 family protein [Fictibacillus iocasae]|uniref:SA1362 family protein n=1 Tax=Fictibacillus iocasae TaxID=2715437 RepID=A0ABW2NMB2_9BACL
MQQRRKIHPVLWGIIILAVIGFLYQLVSSPQELFTTLAITAGIIAVLYFLIKRFSPGSSAPDSGKYQKAVRQSKKRYGSQPTPVKKPSLLSSKQKSSSSKKRKREHNLTVIEGKKNKKKNRASF